MSHYSGGTLIYDSNNINNIGSYGSYSISGTTFQINTTVSGKHIEMEGPPARFLLTNGSRISSKELLNYENITSISFTFGYYGSINGDGVHYNLYNNMVVYNGQISNNTSGSKTITVTSSNLSNSYGSDLLSGLTSGRTLLIRQTISTIKVNNTTISGTYINGF